MRLDQLHKGDQVYYFFDTGAMGVQIIYAEILKIGRKKVLARDEYGGEAWRYPIFFSGYRDCCGLIDLGMHEKDCKTVIG